MEKANNPTHPKKREQRYNINKRSRSRFPKDKKSKRKSLD